MTIYLTTLALEQIFMKGKVNILDDSGNTITLQYGSTNKVCWLCGKHTKITRHHVLCRSWNPFKNIVIPVCKSCQIKVHKDLPHHLTSKVKIKLGPKLHKAIEVIQDNREDCKITYYKRIDYRDGTFNVKNIPDLPVIVLPKEAPKIKRHHHNWVRYC